MVAKGIESSHVDLQVVDEEDLEVEGVEFLNLAPLTAVSKGLVVLRVPPFDPS